MATIGTFTRSGSSYTGAVKTLSINAKTTLKPADKAHDRAPDLHATFYSTLVENEEPGSFSLIWSRRNGD